LKGGDPAPPSDRATLLRLSPPCQTHLRRLSPQLNIGVDMAASGAFNSVDLTGGVYKARERIHPSMADLGLLAIPTS